VIKKRDIEAMREKAEKHRFDERKRHFDTVAQMAVERKVEIMEYVDSGARRGRRVFLMCGVAFVFFALISVAAWFAFFNTEVERQMASEEKKEKPVAASPESVPLLVDTGGVAVSAEKSRRRREIPRPANRFRSVSSPPKPLVFAGDPNDLPPDIRAEMMGGRKNDGK
jgi:hypothetical protein